ncbi:LOW QUALITY PROTEIN: kinesin-like protein KIN-7L [Stegodyphus dumicola]|uniref:LOW QUALITY PROTEIN: kinesin-like protein KIN-7L n=1 Tax=Stegodyphus dumicola TaxID=202533 RepID=UPI0015AB5FA3|nr:LOW QUALITY PROTEIN: kinesin-like protein KIN-7L [Stegodyphus dumicola]
MFNFLLDQVFDSEKSNEEVYSEFCSPIVESVIGGFNGTIFAYGQTSSGKTYTLTGDDEKDIRGIIHYTIYDIFNTIQNMPEREFLLRVSVMEIYNEHVFDLLSEKSENLKLHEDQDGHVNVCGLSEEVVQNSNQVFELMKICQKKRKTGDTLMNERSSRSHLIFRMIIESELRGVENAAVIVSQFNLVDLAGSERVAQTGAKGVRFKESININKSLSMLSHVISQLSVKPIRFISYRGSKLTRILQNSLGGNAKTAIICTITPVSIDDTLSTLKFARRAKCIKNKPEVNKVEGEEALLNRYANEIKKLNEQLQAKEGETLGKEKLQRENEDLQRQIQELKLKFVSQLVPEYEKPAFPKASRRETWGGSLDEARIRNLLTQKKARKQTLQLSMLEEESETETNYSDNEDICDPFFPIPRDMKDTEVQTEVILYLPEQKAVEDAKIQCQLPVCNLCEARKMKEQNERLKSELGGLKEFTTLERQIFSAESQLSKDLDQSTI